MKSTNVIPCKHGINGAFTFALGQKAEIMPWLTDDAFTPLGHDQITVLLLTSVMASLPQPHIQELQREERIPLISSIAFMLYHKVTFYYGC